MRVGLVTGSTRGVGLLVAHELARRGLAVVLHGRSPERAEAACAGLRRQGAACAWVASGVGDQASAEALIGAALGAFGSLDVLVNNAAIAGPPLPAPDVAAEAWDEVLRANLSGPFFCAQAFLRWLRATNRPGRIVNVSSAAAEAWVPRSAPYTASKAGLGGLTRALAAEAPEGVVVTAVALDAVQTDMTRALLPAEQFAALPPPDQAALAVARAALAQGASLHGRTMASWRWCKNPAAEEALCSPLASVPPLPLAPPEPPPGGRPERLDLLENPWGASPAALSALARWAAAPDAHRYPDEGHPALRQAIALRLGIPPARVSLGPGSTSLLERALRLLARPGEEVLLEAPTWPAARRLCAALGLVARGVAHTLDETRHRAAHPIEAMLASISPSTRLIYLSSPANPLGMALDQDATEAFLQRLPPHIALLLDEAYADYTTRPSALDSRALLGLDRPLVVLRSFSKLHGLAGLRVGYAASTPAAAPLLSLLETPYELAAPAALAAEAALADLDHQRRVREACAHERSRLHDACLRLGLPFVGSDASFVAVGHPAGAARLLRSFSAAGLAPPPGPFLGGRYVMIPVTAPPLADRILAALEG